MRPPFQIQLHAMFDSRPLTKRALLILAWQRYKEFARFGHRIAMLRAQTRVDDLAVEMAKRWGLPEPARYASAWEADNARMYAERQERKRRKKAKHVVENNVGKPTGVRVLLHAKMRNGRIVESQTLHFAKEGT